MSVSPDYVHAKVQAAKSHAHNAALTKSGKKYYTPSRNPNDPPPPMMGTPMAVPAEYVAAKMKAEESRAQAKEQKKSSRSSVTSTSDLRCSEETAYSYDKDYKPVNSGKRSLGRKLKDYLHH